MKENSQRGKAAQRAHGGDAQGGRALAQEKRSLAVGPQGLVAFLEVSAAAVILREVEEKLDLDVALVTGELGEATGEGGGVE